MSRSVLKPVLSVVLRKLSFIGHSENPAKARSLLKQTPQRTATRSFYRFKVSGCAQRCSEARWRQEGSRRRCPNAASCCSTNSPKSWSKEIISSVLAMFVLIFFSPTPRANPGASGIPAPCAFFKVWSIFEHHILSSNRSREQGNSCKATNPIQKENKK